MIHISTFSGIGGFELASEWMGWKNYASCEINPFGSKVLEYHWTQAYHHGDIKTLTYELLNEQLIQRFGEGWRNEPIILTGGFPCQPFSLAGKRKGTEDDRHLWPEMLRLIREIKPEYVLGENVGGIISWDGGLVFDQVQTDLEAEGYEVQPFILPACAVNAPHKRDRVWFVAHYAGEGWSERNRSETNIQGREMAEPGQERNSLRNDIGTSDKAGSRITTNPKCAGREEWIENRGWKDSAENGTRMEFWIERSCSNDTTSNSNFNTEGSSPKSGSIETNGGGYNDEQKERRSETQQYIGSHELLRDVADTNGIGLRGESDRIRESRFINETCSPGDWSNFPTQSPVCSRNDGFSSELAGITVPKHRNESIKAYGNAIVPQVAYQIFKAIDQYENSLK